MFFGLGAKPVLGLDIGSSAVKLVELKKARGGYELVAYSSVALPENAIVDGEIVNRDAIVEGIKAVFKDSGASVKQVCSSVSGSNVIIKRIAIPKATGAQVEDQVYWEAEQYIPYDIKEVFLDFEVLNSDMGDGNMEVLLVAVKKDFLEKRIQTITEAGGESKIIDVDCLALANAFWANYDVSDDKAVLLIDIGASVMKINIVSSDSSLFTRDVSIGGRNLTEEIKSKMNVSFQEAEVLKVDSSTSGSMPEEMTAAVSSISENIVLEVRRSIDFFKTSPSHKPISGIYLSGGSAQIPGLRSMMEEMLGMPVETIFPFTKVKYRTDQFNDDFIHAIAPTTVVPIGLALRGMKT